MNYKVLVAAFLAASLVRAADGGFQDPPLRWAKVNGVTVDDTECAMGIDGDMRAAGQRNLSIRCDAPVRGMAGLLQAFEATDYWGQRIRFSAWIRTDGIEGEVGDTEAGAGLFFVPPGGEGIQFDQMDAPALSGWTDWEYREIVIDIPAQGQWINIGFWVTGQGQAWLRDPAFEIVPESVAVTTGVSQQ